MYSDRWGNEMIYLAYIYNDDTKEVLEIKRWPQKEDLDILRERAKAKGPAYCVATINKDEFYKMVDLFNEN